MGPTPVQFNDIHNILPNPHKTSNNQKTSQSLHTSYITLHKNISHRGLDLREQYFSSNQSHNWSSFSLITSPHILSHIISLYTSQSHQRSQTHNSSRMWSYGAVLCTQLVTQPVTFLTHHIMPLNTLHEITYHTLHIPHHVHTKNHTHYTSQIHQSQWTRFQGAVLTQPMTQLVTL